jgi:transcriptional regulator with XRE-family HTH domain
MRRKYKLLATDYAAALGAHLRDSRNHRGFTLKSASKEVQIDVGQLSRFERGMFKRASPNLQRYAIFLQIEINGDSGPGDSISERITAYVARSPDHRAAVENILLALERLG